jgi:hypothetical protein
LCTCLLGKNVFSGTSFSISFRIFNTWAMSCFLEPEWSSNLNKCVNLNLYLKRIVGMNQGCKLVLLFRIKNLLPWVVLNKCVFVVWKTKFHFKYFYFLPDIFQCIGSIGLLKLFQVSNDSRGQRLK